MYLRSACRKMVTCLLALHPQMATMFMGIWANQLQE